MTVRSPRTLRAPLAPTLLALAIGGCGDGAGGSDAAADLSVPGLPDLVEIEDLGPEVQVDVAYTPPDFAGSLTWRGEVVAVALTGPGDGGVDERPLPGALVGFPGGSGVTSGPGGTFALPGVAPGAEVAVQVLQGAFLLTLAERTTAQADVTGPIDVLDTTGVLALAQARGLVADLLGHGELLVRVLDEAGGEYPGATVTLAPAGGDGPLYLDAGGLGGGGTSAAFAAALWFNLAPTPRLAVTVTPRPGDACVAGAAWSPAGVDGGVGATLGASIVAGALTEVSATCNHP